MTKQASVLVIFQHELLGEGLVARLEAMGVRATAVRSCGGDAIARALASEPDVVVVESSDEECLARVRQLRPSVRVVDVTTSVGRGCPAESVEFEAILEALRPTPPLQSPA